MNKQQVDSSFKTWILPSVKVEFEKDGIRDIPARCEAYNNYVDSLHKDRQLTDTQVNKYCIPKNLIN